MRASTSPWRSLLRVGIVVIVAALAALLIWATLSAGKGTSLVAKIAEGERPEAPAFQHELLWRRAETWPPDLRSALAGGSLSLDELRGYAVVLNIWASWCIPCREEAPILAASAHAHQGEVVFLGVDVQDLRGDALAFLRELDVPYPSVRDHDNQLYQAYGLTGVPETYFITPGGHISAHSAGPVTRETLERGIATATLGDSP